MKSIKARINKIDRGKYLRNYGVLYLMALPMVIYYIIFHFLPMTGIILSFMDYRVSGFKGWVGFDNFKYIFNLKFFWEAFRNTWVIVLFRYLFIFPAPIILAILLTELPGKRNRKFIQTISTLPHFISWVVVSGIWLTMLSPSSGYVNAIIAKLGGEPIYFWSLKSWFYGLFTFVSGWKTVGYSSIIYLAAIAGIDPQLYEAAQLDGAHRGQMAWHITMPGIRTTILVVLILSFAGVMNMFEPVLVFQNKMILETAEVLDTYVYKTGVVKGRYPMATAIGLFKSTISLFLVLGTNFLSKKISPENESIL